ncbi:TPA: ABC transporter ATP-binding protein [Clostridioides difficile]|nr:ABC transporter ATP-binding protein [Clostridioides difficile]EQG74351.1 ABC transporter family protein [Clostridioides difficile DA00165]AXU28892.1 ABC transporter [Clostridioides difficile]AXU32680.1 ABC transporter [Clostridioides difficile]AXU36468.1 ABC transporter [Clostridioides difficile]EAA0009148.1 ABC transporter ATP-binding protein [Clostridioides difficile]
MNEIVIKVENISKVYKLYEKPIDRLKETIGLSKKVYHTKHYALENLSFQVEKGETIGIIGTNGSGKSTLLKMITGVLTPTSGNIIVNGKISALLELGAGFNPEYTGIENIYLNGTMMGYKKEEMDDKIESILEFADIGEFINQPVKTYSSGMFSRLAFAVAINVEPDILIVDEALSVGDVFFQAKCYKKFNDFKKQGRTIIFVSHDMGSIMKYCDKTLLIDRGKFVDMGPSANMIDIYKKILVNQYVPDSDNEEIIEDVMEIEGTNKWYEKLQINPTKLEYGNKKAEIIDFAIVDDKNKINNNINKGTIFNIKMKVKFNENIDNPIYAFTIKDLKGTDVTGTNTMLEHIDTNKYDDKGEVIIVFKQKMDLQGGSYLLSLGCTGYESEDFTVYNRLYDICNINVISLKNSVGYYDMNSEIEIY